MKSAATLLGLPLELQDMIIEELEFPDNVFLRSTCRCFRTIIKPLTHQQLLQIEETKFAEEHGLYACRDCLRMRPATKFADTMSMRKRKRFGKETFRRFCLECGLFSGSGNARYSRGDQIMIRGVCHAICIRCGEFGEAGLDEGTKTSECLRCWARTKAYREGIRQREEEFRRTQEVRLRNDSNPSLTRSQELMVYKQRIAKLYAYVPVTRR